MYRVELKELYQLVFQFTSYLLVPNVPCGVESGSYFLSYSSAGMFLMYRVELKGKGYSV